MVSKSPKNREMSKISDSKCRNPTGEKEHSRCVQHSLQMPKILMYRRNTLRVEKRKKEYLGKVRLKREDTDVGNLQRATERMKTWERRMAKHVSTWSHKVDRENTNIIRKKRRSSQRKCLEGIESLCQQNRGVTPLNSYNQLEQWHFSKNN